jgi:hypothetical protein
LADAALEALGGEFAALYSKVGRPSIAPEMLLRAMLLQAFYSIRSERQLMAQRQRAMGFFNDLLARKTSEGFWTMRRITFRAGRPWFRAEKIGCALQTLNEWLKKAEIDTGNRAGVPGDIAEKLKALERENRELRQANEILRKASVYFAQAELDHPFRR